MKVLHVTESFASGVMDLIATITSRQLEAGASVHVLYATRPDTPSDEALARIFAPGVRLIKVSERHTSKLSALLNLRRTLRSELRSSKYDAIHLHSTFAGVLGRVAIGHPKLRSRTFYSPHGFGFLRQDLSPVARRMTLLAERFASRRGSLILTTESEFEIAQRSLPNARCELVINGIDISALPEAHRDTRKRPQVVMVGRVTYQKAPWVFARIANALKEHADFVWFGDGADEDKTQWLEGQPVELTGWMPLPLLRTRLAQADLMLFPTLWEGMPLSLIEAQAIGLPAIATRIVGNRDIVIDGETGFLCDSEEELLERTRLLVLDAGLRDRMRSSALELVRPKFDDRNIGTKSLNTYTSATARQAARSGHIPRARSRS